jgi:hypothetical protein
VTVPATQVRHTHHILLVAATILSRMSIWIYGLYAVGQGVGIIAGGPGRWSSPAYAVVKQIPGGPNTWGIILILAGVITIIGSVTREWLIKTVGLVTIILWSLCFSFGAFAAWFQSSTAGTTGGPVYLKDALMAIVLLLVDERIVTRK